MTPTKRRERPSVHRQLRYTVGIVHERGQLGDEAVVDYLDRGVGDDEWDSVQPARTWMTNSNEASRKFRATHTKSSSRIAARFNGAAGRPNRGDIPVPGTRVSSGSHQLGARSSPGLLWRPHQPGRVILLVLSGPLTVNHVVGASTLSSCTSAT